MKDGAVRPFTVSKVTHHARSRVWPAAAGIMLLLLGLIFMHAVLPSATTPDSVRPQNPTAAEFTANSSTANGDISQDCNWNCLADSPTCSNADSTCTAALANQDITEPAARPSLGQMTAIDIALENHVLDGPAPVSAKPDLTSLSISRT